MTKRIILLTICLTIILMLSTTNAFAQTAIYRSVGPNKTTALDDDDSQSDTISITGSTATFSENVVKDVGVGDVILYDSDEDNDLDGSDSIVFIHGRTSSTSYTVKDHDGAAPSNTTTANDKWAIYRAHTSLSNAEAGTENSTLSGLGFTYNGGDRNISSGLPGGNDEVWNIACYANGTTADTTAVTIDGWTTDVDNYIKIYTPTSTSEVGTSQRHNAKWDTSKYRLTQTTGTSCLSIQDDYVRIEGIQFNQTGWVGGLSVNNISASNDIRISQVVAYAGEGVISIDDSDAIVTVWDCILYDATSPWKAGIQLGAGTVYSYNNTAHNCDVGFRAQGTSFIAKNNIAQDCDRDGFYGSFTSSDYNISDITGDTTSISPSYQPGVALDVTFQDAANDDFHLSSSDTAARDAGTSDPGSGLFSDDIDGATRVGAWDIGADETAMPIYRSVGPNKTTAVDDDNSQGETLTISGSTATFNTASVADNVGVGDVILYDSDNDDDLDPSDSVVFIHGRTDSKNFTVKDDDGTAPDTTTTTNDKWAIYRAHTSLSNAEAGTKNTSIPVTFNGGDRDLLSNNEQWNIACYANGTTADTSLTTIGYGWTTGSENYIRVYTPVSTSEVGTTQRHQGKWDDNKYHLAGTVSTGYGDIIAIAEEYVRIDGLQAKISTGSGNTGAYCISASVNNAASDIRISNNIITEGTLDAGTTSNVGVMVSYNGILNTSIWNNIIYDFAAGSADGQGIYGNTGVTYNKHTYVYNNTIIDCDVGISSGSEIVMAKNNLVKGSGSGTYSGTFADGTDYNATDSDDDIGKGSNNEINQNFTFIDETGNDFHLAYGDLGAKSLGTNLSSDPYCAFSDDIDGEERPFKWSMGADNGLDHTTLRGVTLRNAVVR